MATIDDIRIKLAVDATEVATGIKRVSSVMDSELRKKRTAQVNLTLHRDASVTQALKDLKDDIRGAGKVNVQIGLADFDAAPIAKQLTDDLKQLPGGGVKVPVVLDTKLTKREMASTQRDLRAAIGVVTVDWQLAAQPKGGWPEPPPGWGGNFSGGGGPGPTGPGPGPTAPPAGPAPAPGAAGKAPRSEEQRTNDVRRRKAMADAKKARDASDQEAIKRAEEELAQATAERDRLAKERRDADVAERKAKNAQDREGRAAKKAQAETQGEAPEAPGIGGRKAGQRAAKRAEARSPEAHGFTPTGAPAGNILIKQPKTLPGTERPPSAAMGRGDPLANNIGKGKEEKFRRSAAPRDLMAAGVEMTPEGELRAKMGLPLGAEHFKTIVKQGETPKTANPMMGVRMEQRFGKERMAGLRSWAEEMRQAGVGGGLTTVEDARAYLKSLTPGEKRRIYEKMSLPQDIGESMGGAMDPLKDPATAEAFLVALGAQAEHFDEQAEHTAGGIVNVNAGARLKDPPTRVKGGGQITGGAIEQALKQASTPFAKRGVRKVSEKEDETLVAAPTPKVKPKMRSKELRPEEARRLAQIEGATAHLAQARMSAIRAGLTDLTPERPIEPERQPTPLNLYESPTVSMAREKKEREEALARAKRVAEERARKIAAAQAQSKAATNVTAPTGAFKLRIPGMAEGGAWESAHERFKARMDAWQAENPMPEGPYAGGSHLTDPAYQAWSARRQFHSRWIRDALKDEMAPGWRERRDAWAGVGGAAQKAKHSSAIVQKLMAMATQESQSPNEAAIAKRMLHDKGVPGYAEGGEVRHTGLLGRMAQRGDPRAVTLVGERGPELIVTDEKGESEVVPTHKVATWVQLMQQGRGRAKDFTGRAAGGPISFNMRGRTGFQSAAQVSRGTVSSGDIARVFVVNWPSSFTGQPGGRPVRVTPTTPTGKPVTMAAASGTVNLGGVAGGGPGVAAPKGAPLPTAQAVAQANPPEDIRPREDPLFRARVESALRGERFRSRDVLQGARTSVGVALAENPVRAFAVAFSQFVQTKTGRGELLERAGVARTRIAEADAARGERERLLRQAVFARADIQRLRGRVAAGTATPAQQEDLAEQERTYGQLRKAVRFTRFEMEGATKAALEAADGLGGVGGQLKNLAVGGASVIGAGFLFSGAMAAMNAAVGLAGATVKDVTERSLGYRNATAELTKELAAGTRASGGSAKAATAAKFAMSGLADETSERLLPALSARAQGVAGNQALQEQVQQIAAAQNVGLNRPAGLPGGFDTSLVKATGGPFDLGILPGILSERSTSDILRNSLDQVPTANTAGLSPAAQKALAGYNLQNIGPLDEKDIAAADTALNDWLQTVTERGQKGGALAQLEQSVDPEAIDKTIKAFKEIGADDFAESLQRRKDTGAGVALTGNVNPYIAAQFLDAQSRGGLKPSAGNLITQLTAPIGGGNGISQLDATLRDIRRRGAFQRDITLPAQTTLAYAARPLAPYMDQRLRPTGTVAGVKDGEGTVAAYQTAFEKYAKFAEPAQARINAQIEKGRKTLESWIGPDLLSNITDLGQDIQDIQLGISQRGLNLEVSQYNNEIRIATRQLNQAKDFTSAIKGNVKDTIGGLQGQNYQLGRSLQLLQQELQQRQINLGLAVAGFQVAGETPEERAARQDAAIAEANFAQKQLDLQKQMGSNEFTIGLKENANAVTDLTAQIGLLREGKSLTIDTFAAEEAIKRMDADLELLQQQAQERMNEALQMSDVQMGIIADIERETGEVFDRWQEKLFPAFRKAGTEAGKAATDFVVASIIAGWATNFNGQNPAPNSSGSPDDRQERNDAMAQQVAGQWYYNGKPVTPQMEIDLDRDLNYNGIIGKATGGLFNTTGVTSPMVVGEAGRETVAILRNPREGSLGGGFGGGSISININLNGNVSMRNEADIAILAQKIEERLSARMAMTRR